MIKTGVVTEADLKKLTAFGVEDAWVVSLYLDVDGAKHPRLQDYEKDLHNLIHQAHGEWISGSGRATKEKSGALLADLDLIENYVTGEWRRNGTKGLAVFSCQRHGFWRAYDLPCAVPSALMVGAEPYTKTLAAVLDKYERFCVAAVDRKKLRIFTVYLGEIEEERRLVVNEWVPDQVKEGEWAGLRQSRIARHIDDHVMRHLKEAARRTYAFFINNKCDHLILAGHVDLMPKFKEVLHPYLQARVAGEFKIDPGAGPEEFRRKSLEVEGRVRQRQEEDLVSRVREQGAPGGLGITGLDPTVGALMRGQAHSLLVAEDYSAPGYVCYTDHYLTTQEGDCPTCGRALRRSDDLVEDMVQLAVNQNARIVYIAGVQDFIAGERVGALLRYPTPGERQAG